MASPKVAIVGAGMGPVWLRPARFGRRASRRGYEQAHHSRIGPASRCAQFDEGLRGIGVRAMLRERAFRAILPPNRVGDSR